MKTTNKSSFSLLTLWFILVTLLWLPFAAVGKVPFAYLVLGMNFLGLATVALAALVAFILCNSALNTLDILGMKFEVIKEDTPFLMLLLTFLVYVAILFVSLELNLVVQLILLILWEYLKYLKIGLSVTFVKTHR
ncbi:hypothetical protein HYV31_01220 [candidate division WWE3 bacterium]|nr:hypothetical protein [candidate division WWE3 bacterium]